MKQGVEDEHVQTIQFKWGGRLKRLSTSFIGACLSLFSLSLSLSLSLRFLPTLQACHHLSKFGTPIEIWSLGQESKNIISIIAYFAIMSRDLIAYFAIMSRDIVASCTTHWAICFADFLAMAPQGHPLNSSSLSIRCASWLDKKQTVSVSGHTI